MGELALHFLKSDEYHPMIPGDCRGFFFFQLASDVDGMKYLSSYSTARLYAINIDMNGKIHGALVLFGCYQHRYEWKGLHVLKPPPY